MMYGTEGQRAAVGSDRAETLRDILGGGNRSSWYVVSLDDGSIVAVSGGLVAVDFDALDEVERDIFDNGSTSEVAGLAVRVGWTLDVIGNPVIWCPVGDLVASRHVFEPGTGVVVEWSVMGDRRKRVEVCADCADGVGS